MHCVTLSFGDTRNQRHSCSSAAAEMENTLLLQAAMTACLIHTKDSRRCFMLKLYQRRKSNSFTMWCDTKCICLNYWRRWRNKGTAMRRSPPRQRWMCESLFTLSFSDDVLLIEGGHTSHSAAHKRERSRLKQEVSAESQFILKAAATLWSPK